MKQKTLQIKEAITVTESQLRFAKKIWIKLLVKLVKQDKIRQR